MNVLGFSSKSSLSEKVREIVDRYKDDEPITGDDFALMVSVLALHPRSEEKTGCGVSSIFVRPMKYKKTTRCFWVRRADGTETDFSWLKCVNGHDRAMTNLMEACRNAVHEEIVAFKEKAFSGVVPKCAISGEDLTWTSAHVHHGGEFSFKRIAEMFIELECMPEELVAVRGFEDGTCGKHFVNQDTAYRFRAFHQRMAKLELVKMDVHLKMEKGPEKWL